MKCHSLFIWSHHQSHPTMTLVSYNGDLPAWRIRWYNSVTNVIGALHHSFIGVKSHPWDETHTDIVNEARTRDEVPGLGEFYYYYSDKWI